MAAMKTLTPLAPLSRHPSPPPRERGEVRREDGVAPLPARVGGVAGEGTGVRARTGRQAGFTLIELRVSLVLLLLGLALAAQILMESAQLFAESAGEQIDAPIPLAIARLRGDVLASSSFQVATGEDGLQLVLAGHPAGTVLYEKAGEELRRSVLDAAGEPGKATIVLRGVSEWICFPASPRLVVLGVSYRRHAVPRSPLPRLPAFRGPRHEERQEWLTLAPRGGGLGDGW